MGIINTWHRFKAWLKDLHSIWLNKRIPSNNSVQLNINNTFILPTSFGWSCIGIAVCLFVLGTNFQNNVILLLCYFLIAVILLSVFHSYFYFIQHKIEFLPIQADFENRQLYQPIQINSTEDYQGGCLSFQIENKGIISLQQQAKKTIRVPLPSYTRGQYHSPRVSLSCIYGFGLFKCWSHLSPDIDFLVYPKIFKAPMNLVLESEESDLGLSSDSQLAISDNLQGIREYQATDPIHHISWKHLAKGQGLLTKDFSENQGVSGWLRLQDIQHLGLERALQCLCYQIQQLEKDHVKFGLDLGTTKLLPQTGPKHIEECLSQLALYSSSPTKPDSANASKHKAKA